MKKLSRAKQDQVARALKVLEEHCQYNEQSFQSAIMAKNYFTLRLSDKQSEQFEVAFLTSQHRLIECETMFRGTINQAPVFPREIVRRALELNASAILLAHNHPSGIAEPSQADRNITERICEAAKLLDIRVLDHFIVGGINTYSFAEHGLL